MFLKRPLTSAALATGIAFGALATAPVLAQTATPGAELVEQDGMLDAFIDAAMNVAEVRDGYLEQLQTAETEAEQTEIIEMANNAILTTVEDTPGITVDEYIAIGEAAAADPELNQMLNDRVAETMGME